MRSSSSSFFRGQIESAEQFRFDLAAGICCQVPLGMVGEPDLVLFPALEMLSPSKADHVFLEGAPCFRSNALLLCANGNPTIFAHPVENGGSRKKTVPSETPSIGWEAKTLGAKRRNSSSEIATVPGTVDLVELLFSAVLMLVDWLVGFVSRSREARLWELPEFFRRSVSVEKVMIRQKAFARAVLAGVGFQDAQYFCDRLGVLMRAVARRDNVFALRAGDM